MTQDIVFRGRKIQVAVRSVASGGRNVPYDVVIHPGAVAILPLVDEGHICLLRNQRPVVGAQLWEIPAGTLEPQEPPELAAIRELAEETGYRANRWRKLSEFYPSPGILSECTHLYLAQDLTSGPMQLEPGEEIEPEIVEWRQALDWVQNGVIKDAKTLVAILLWERMKNGE